MFWKVEYFVRDFTKAHGPFSRVLDVGSRNINGSVRDVINTETFIGVDMIAGPGVDIVANGHDLAKIFPETRDHFDLITCCETFEHDNKFWLTLEAMKKILNPGGYLLITAPSINFFLHDFPSDYYRFTETAFKDVFFEGFEDVHVEYYQDENDPVKQKPNNSILGYGRKPQTT